MKDEVTIKFKPKDLLLKIFAGIGIGVVAVYILTWLFQLVVGFILLWCYWSHYN